jgi:hypothetical protein
MAMRRLPDPAQGRLSGLAFLQQNDLSVVLRGESERQVFADQTVGIKQTDDRIRLVSFMDSDLGYIDDETCRLEPLANPFGPKVLPMSSE